MLFFFILRFHRMILMETILKMRFLENFISGSARILHHIALAALSAAIALSLPRILNFIDDHPAPKHSHGYPSKRMIFPLDRNRKRLVCIDEGFRHVW